MICCCDSRVSPEVIFDAHPGELFVVRNVASLGDGKNMSRSDYLARLEYASIVATLSDLMSFPWINSRVAGQQLKLLAAYFDVGSGTLEVYDPIAGAFTPITIEGPAAE
jgi:carbonic anhydrase